MSLQLFSLSFLLSTKSKLKLHSSSSSHSIQYLFQNIHTKPLLSSSFLAYRKYQLQAFYKSYHSSTSIHATSSSSHGSYNLRIATANDIENIKSCNLKTLPENYDDEYYHRHITSWPELAIVAESPNKTCLGYTLGRVDVLDGYQPSMIYSQSQSDVMRSFCQGHVTSLAVYEEYRGNGIAEAMLRKLHFQFVNCYNVTSVNLKCRVSYCYL